MGLRIFMAVCQGMHGFWTWAPFFWTCTCFLDLTISFFPRASEHRVLPIVGVCKTSSHLHIFSSSHLLILTSSHPHIFSSSHLLILTSSHLHILTSSHLLIFTSSHLHILSSSHLLIFISSHPHIFTSSHLHIFSSSHLLIFTSSLGVVAWHVGRWLARWQLAGWVVATVATYKYNTYTYIHMGGRGGGDGGEEHPQNTPAGRRIHTYAGGWH